jgi:hypothetical protein
LFDEPRISGSPTLFLTGKRGAQPHFAAGNIQEFEFRSKGTFIVLAQAATGTSRSLSNASIVAGLARFFPEATPVRIPVQLARSLQTDEVQGDRFTESTVIEFGTPREVLFSCNTPLEFADVLHLRNSDGSLDIEASVVAVQYHPGQTIVAARFLREVPNWIVKS